MKFSISSCSLSIAFILNILSGSVMANQDFYSLNDRVTRLESVINNQITADTFNQIEALQQEVRELRGRLETLDRKNSSNQRISSLIINDDNNINILEKTPVAAKKNTEEELYKSAYSLLEKKQYEEAILSLQDFLWQYPEGTFAPNAKYWLAEIYLFKWKEDKNNTNYLEQSIQSFKTVVNQHRQHHKSVDALLKLGLVNLDLEEWNEAANYFNQLKNNYPSSSRSKIAEVKLKELEQQGKI